VVDAPPYCLIKGDAIDVLRTIADESIDLVVTDPPYESLEKHRKIGTTTRLKQSKASSNEWFEIFPNRRFPELFSELFRVLKKNAHFYLFCDQETMFVVKPLAVECGFKFWKPLVWDKKQIGMGYHYRARYEFVLFFEKGKRKLNNLGIPDIIEAPRIHRGYPTEKPDEVARVFIEQSSSVGEIVLDPFFGSGSTGVAARALGRRFVGVDLAESAHRCAKDRLGADDDPALLPTSDQLTIRCGGGGFAPQLNAGVAWAEDSAID
jgi:site-specific DNA-methyltransferase (adenine-specific)